MLKKQNIQQSIFEDLYHKEMWNNVIEELNKVEYGKLTEFYNFDELEEYCYNKLNYKGKIPIKYCFACEYAGQFKYKDKRCENCPFEGIDPDKYCLNYIYAGLRINYNQLERDQDKQMFNYHKRECIEDAIKIRDWKIKEDVLCRSNVK